jgi:hypothetical protein
MDKSFRKILIDAGPIPSVRKGVYNDALKALGEELRQDGDSDPKAYTRAMETAEGRDLFALYKVAPPDPPEDYVEPAKPAPRGVANVEMQMRVGEHLKAHPELAKDAFGRQRLDGGKAAAYTFVLTHPDNRELAARVKADDLAGVPRTPAGRVLNMGLLDNRLAAARKAG